MKKIIAAILWILWLCGSLIMVLSVVGIMFLIVFEEHWTEASNKLLTTIQE